MKRMLWGAFLFIVPLWFIPQAVAQNPNIAYYEKVWESSDFVIYSRVWYADVPGAENDPPHPQQFYVPPDGNAWCDPPPGQACQPCIGCDGLQAALNSIILDRKFDFQDDDPTELPPITVTIPRQNQLSPGSTLLLVSESGGSGCRGRSCGGGFTGIPIIPEEAEPCNTGEWQNIDDNVAKRVFSNPQIMEQLKDMIEQSALGGVEKGGRIVVTELALGGFAVKFEPLSDWGTINEESCTHIDFEPDVSIQEGNYTVHTHMACPGVPYPDPMPSPQDRQTLREHNFEGGIIIDMKHDKIITYGPDEDDNDPGQQEDACGSVE